MVNIRLKNIQFWFYPPTCLLCGAPGIQDLDLCAGCRADLPGNHNACMCCGLALAVSSHCICGQCQQKTPAYERTMAPFLYQTPLDYLLPMLKFKGKLVYARLLGQLMADYLQQQCDCLPERLIPVPLHPSRLRERGFNQALELARPIAKRLKIGIDHKCCLRIRRTAPQTELDARQRRVNVRRAFRLTRTLPVRHVAIVDDVMTTGTTVNELARTLRRAGVRRVDVWACARAAPYQYRD